jgi:hypothetical protein
MSARHSAGASQARWPPRTLTKPRTSFEELIRLMTRSDLELLRSG